MAMIFPYFELAASLFILLLAFEILTRHYENKLARFYSFFGLIAFLAAILTYSFRIAFTLDLARDINRLSASLWSLTFALYAHFSLLFTRKEKLLKNPLTYLLLYLPPAAISSLFLFTNLMYVRHEIVSIGIISQPAPLYSLFLFQTLGHTLWGIFLMFSYAHTAPQKIERQQAFLIGLGSLIPVAIGVTTDQLLPVILGFRPTIPTVVFDIALMNFFIYLAMRYYSLFAITPALAADTIIETMPDSLLVTDLEGHILFLNEEATKFFRIPKEEIIGKPIQALFKNSAKYDQLYREVVDQKLEVGRFEAELIDPLGERIPALINASLLREKVVGETLGIVFVIRDTRG
jgi:PAS domain S-box-containing protein